MAIVPLNPEVKHAILTKVRQIHEADLATLNFDVSTEVKDGMGDELYSWVLPADTEKKLIALMPEWAFREQSYVYLSLRDKRKRRPAFNVCLALKPGHLNLKAAGQLTIPGCSYAHFDSVTLTMDVEDTDKLPGGLIKGLIQSMDKVKQQQDKIIQAADEACDTMKKFLDQHRTIQSATKEFGPAFHTYLDTWLLEELKRIPPKRVRNPPKPKEALEPVNVNKLISKATATKLNL